MLVGVEGRWGREGGGSGVVIHQPGVAPSRIPHSDTQLSEVLTLAIAPDNAATHILLQIGISHWPT
ncbi:hypothetical protein E2C01_022925 [Portunus trituberculatus]|uniref:Uncharacterized protein n=1 Tax=Portunus trituberculatus TaxID=210409 RepID=A0A5B7E6N9_PORTR|nr:hypothetical protein [Portunus trituberculatus]